MTKLSIVVPVLNESNNPILPHLLASFEGLATTEIIFVDGGSSDDTLRILADFGYSAIQLPTSNRAERLNKGIESANGDMILLHHPRSFLDPEAFDWLHQQNEVWGGFTHKFDMDHPLLRFTSWYSNKVRGPRGIIYLDHCIFAPRRWLHEVGLVEPLDVFEDTAICSALRRSFGRPIVRTEVSTTSAIRFRTNGLLRQSLINQGLKVAYLTGWNHRRMNRIYEKNVSLNVDLN